MHGYSFYTYVNPFNIEINGYLYSGSKSPACVDPVTKTEGCVVKDGWFIPRVTFMKCMLNDIIFLNDTDVGKGGYLKMGTNKQTG